MRVIVLHSAVPAGAQSDEQDNLVQAFAVSEGLRSAGHEVVTVPFSPGELAGLEGVDAVVFNLVESINGRGDLIYLAPGLLEAYGVPYTGCPAQAMMNATHKTVAKRLMQGAGIPTAPWADLRTLSQIEIPLGERYMLKPVGEDASIALDDEAVVRIESKEQLRRELARREETLGFPLFAERYIEGREYNISMLGGPDDFRVLPIAEMIFSGYPAGKPRIVSYAAKWDEQSFEYRHTSRSFERRTQDEPLHAELIEICKRCWRVFGLNGYARVDLRVDEQGQPWVLEINPDPGIAPDAGFVAAAAQAGLRYGEMVAAILAFPVLPVCS